MDNKTVKKLNTIESHEEPINDIYLSSYKILRFKKYMKKARKGAKMKLKQAEEINFYSEPVHVI